jgi:hypothetical protein
MVAGRLPGLPGEPDSRDRLIDELASGEPQLCPECGGRFSHPRIGDEGNERAVLRCPLCNDELVRIDDDTLCILQRILDRLNGGEADP